MTCPECGGPVEAIPGYEGRTKFCSTACQNRDYRRRKNVERDAIVEANDELLNAHAAALARIAQLEAEAEQENR